MAVDTYLDTAELLVRQISVLEVGSVYRELRTVRTTNGRVFVAGNGGGQAHASHFAADLRKLGRIEAYAWGDNTADLTAWVNDDSWDDSVNNWLDASRPTKTDALFVFSVGGGSSHTSANLAKAMWRHDTKLLGIVGSDGGELLGNATACVVLPTSDTCQVEGLQSIVAHCLIDALCH